MLFNSTVFLLFFLPISLVLYFLVPDKMRNGVLLAESLVFYSYGALKYLPLLLIIVAVDYILAGFLGTIDDSDKGIIKKRVILVSGIVINAALIVFFKYGVYLSYLFDRIGNGRIELSDIIPLGVSYYTFKSISYLCDVFNKKCEPERNLIDYAAYILMYQQMIVGPIIRYADIKDQLRKKGPVFDPKRCADGTRRFVYGLSKKVILADTLGMMWNELAAENGMDLSQASSGLVWFAVLCYSLQLYLDFSGYSEMSNGLSEIMGFSCKDNFNYPYCAASVTEFWRRWHITLTEWFRDYVYIPLGGNRKGMVRQVINLLIVWVLTGIWHGSTVNFIIWGIYYFIILILEKFLIGKYIKNKIFGRIYTLFVAAVGWGIFASGKRIPVACLIAKLFSFSKGISAVYYIRNYGVIFILSVLVSAGIYGFLRRKVFRFEWIENTVVILLLSVSFAYVVGSTGNAALYAAF